MNIGFSIKKLRKQKGLNQQDLADKAEITQTALSQIESGKKSPNTKTVEKLCDALQIPISLVYVLSMEEEDVPTNKKEDFARLFPKLKDLVLEMASPKGFSFSE